MNCSWRDNRLAGLASAFLLSFSAVGATYYVDNKLDDYAGHDGSSWEKAYQRIQDAVGKAANDDVVLVAPGEYGDDQGVVIDSQSDGGNVNYSYRENRIWINNKHITLKSSEGAAKTHIVGRHSPDTPTGVGSNSVRCISLSGNNNIGGTRIEGFTIRDGATLEYGTGKAYNTKTGAIVSNCEASHRGGGVLFNYVDGGKASQIHIVDCVISNCVAGEGAAVYGASVIRSRLTCNRTDRAGGAILVQGNAANSVFDFNGGVEKEGTMRVCRNFQVRAVNCTFFANKGVFDCGKNFNGYGYMLNCFIQRNDRTTSSAYLTDYGRLTNCVTDVDVMGLTGCANNTYLDNRQKNAQLAAPLFGDFRPVAQPSMPQLFGRGDKAFCQDAWIPEDDRNKDFFGNARWDDDDKVTVGAVQGSVEMGGGCLTITSGGRHYKIDGVEFDRPNNGYFYETRPLAQHRVTFIPGADDASQLGHVWLGGYTSSWRYPDCRGELVVTLPPASTDNMLCVQPESIAQVIWADANYKGGDSDGTAEKPYVTLQDAVSAASTASDKFSVVMVRPGRYDQGGGTVDFWGLARVYCVNRNVCIRSTEGPEKTFIVGAPGENPTADGCGTNALRCVSVNYTKDTERRVGVVGFTLTGGRTWPSGLGTSAKDNCRCGGGFFSTDQINAQLVDSVITDCIGVRGSAAYKGLLFNCRVFGCTQATAPSGATETIAARGVCWRTFLSGSVIGPNNYKVVSVDQDCKLWNSTVYETSTIQHLSADSDYCNVLDLGSTYLPKMNRDFSGVAVYSSNFSGVNPQHEYLQLTAMPLASPADGDFRPLAGSAIVSGGVAPNANDAACFLGSGIHRDLLVRDGQAAIGADADVATPVAFTKDRWLELGGFGTPYVSEGQPLTVTATRMDREFNGFKVNGELVTTDRTLTLSKTPGVGSYTIDPLYAPMGFMLLFR